MFTAFLLILKNIWNNELFRKIIIILGLACALYFSLKWGYSHIYNKGYSVGYTQAKNELQADLDAKYETAMESVRLANKARSISDEKLKNENKEKQDLIKKQLTEREKQYKILLENSKKTDSKLLDDSCRTNEAEKDFFNRKNYKWNK